MKHPNDKKLSELLQKKMANLKVADSEADRLWTGIEETLPSKSFSHSLAYLVWLPVLVMFSLMLFYGTNEIPTESVVANSQAAPSRDSGKIIDEELGRNEGIGGSSGQVKSGPSVLEKHPQVQAYPLNDNPDNSNPDPIAERIEKNKVDQTLNSHYPEFRKRELKLVESEPTFDAHFVEKRSTILQLHLIGNTKPIQNYQGSRDVLDVNGKSTTPFLYAKSAVTYHTVDPSLSDEIIIGSSPNGVSPKERISIGVGYGTRKQFFKNIEGRISAGVYYNRSKLFLSAQDREVREVEVDVNRLDLETQIGLDFQNSGFIADKETFSLSLGARARMFNFSNNNSLTYSRMILFYEIGYYFQLNSIDIGPYYSSFFNSMDHLSIGRIRPNMFGVTLRKRILK